MGIACAAAWLGVSECGLASQPVVREPGALYLSDFDTPPLKLQLKGPTPAFFGIDLGRYAGTLRYPQRVEVQAISDGAFRVRGNAQQGQVLAWIPPEALEGVPADLLGNLRAAEERRKVVDDLISRNEVAIGMTMEEVRKSIGRPKRTTKRANAEGSEEIWEYIRYKLVPQQTVVNTPSGPAVSTIFIRVPSGTMEVRSQDGIVQSLEQTEGTLAGAGVSIVVPPVVISW